MQVTNCPECLKLFSRRDVMIRYSRHRHYSTKISQACPQSNEVNPQSTEAYPPPSPPQRDTPPPPQDDREPPPPPPQQDSNDSTLLKRIFTMMISGPTDNLIFLVIYVRFPDKVVLLPYLKQKINKNKKML